MRRFAVVAVLLAGSVSHADVTRNIELTVFDPTPSTDGSTFQAQHADVGAKGELAVSTWISYASNPLVLRTAQNDDAVVRRRTMFVLGGSYALTDWLEAGARIPLYNQDGVDFIRPVPGQPQVFSVPPADGTVVGDLTLHGKARLWRRDAWSIGSALLVKLPTANDGEFAGTAMPSARLLGLLSFTPVPQLAVHVNAGGILRERAEFANIVQGSGVTWAAGVTYRLAHPLFFDLQAFGDVVPSGRFDEMGVYSTQATMEGLLGVRYFASQQTSLGLAAGRGLIAEIGSPDLRIVATLAYTPSAPPLPPLRVVTPEPPPDPTKLDTDYDRLVDAVDKCPQQREDKDGFEDSDGCPDPDNDKDGVLDDQDKCGDASEDIDKFDDTDGCPDPDNDKDGVLDAADKCPLEPEKINGVDDDDGCADKGESLVISNPERLELLESVLFTGATVSKASANVLAQLATTLRMRADIVRVRISVHVNPSRSRDRDQKLSDQRAESVRDWLTKRGVAADRIEARGFGSSKPLVPASQKGAEAINDRVELIILERK